MGNVLSNRGYFNFYTLHYFSKSSYGSSIFQIGPFYSSKVNFVTFYQTLLNLRKEDVGTFRNKRKYYNPEPALIGDLALSSSLQCTSNEMQRRERIRGGGGGGGNFRAARMFFVNISLAGIYFFPYARKFFLGYPLCINYFSLT